jgi:2'-5' RNA ligase
MKKPKKYSLWLIFLSHWLMPSERLYRKLTNLIFQLSKENSSPNFEPHITLFGLLVGPENEIIEKTFQLSNLINPFEIKLTKIGYLGEYFRCLFIKVEKTVEIMNTNLKSKELLGKYYVNPYPDSKFMPHLSLMYGNFSSKIKEEIISKIGKDFNIKFEVNKIHLFSTDGEPKDWHKIKEFILK